MYSVWQCGSVAAAYLVTGWLRVMTCGILAASGRKLFFLPLSHPGRSQSGSDPRCVETKKKDTTMNPFRRLLYVFSGLLLITPWLTQAGDIDSPAPPDDEISAMFTLQDIHDRLNDGSAGAQRGAFFVDPISGPAASVSANLNDIMGIAPSVDLLNGAAAGQVLQGRTFWGLDSAAVWGPATGSMPDIGAQVIIPGTAAQGITMGFHDGAGSVSGDPNLVTENIKAGTSIFSVTGKTEVVDTTSGDAVAGDLATGKKAWVDGVEITGSNVTLLFPAPVGKTGQTTCYDAGGSVTTCGTGVGIGQDGDLKPGVAWPNPRFTKNNIEIFLEFSLRMARSRTISPD